MMYEQFFSMDNTPFTRDIPADRLYISTKIDDALGRLKYSVDKQGFAVVMADPGCGKSTLMRILVSRLSKEKYLPLYDLAVRAEKFLLRIRFLLHKF